MDAPPIRRTESWFTGSGGRSLFRRAWLPPEPQVVLAVVHGYAEHSGRYDHLGAWFAARGCAVEAFDQQGHGRSDGPRGHVRRFDDLLDDVDRFLALLREAHPSRPTFLLGHSMGGLVVAAWACRRDAPLGGLVLSAAALQVSDMPSPLQRLLMRMLRRVAPRVRIARPIAEDALSRDPEVGRAYHADPLVFQSLTLGLGVGLVDAAAQVLREADRVRRPMLLLHGADDRLTLPSGSRAFFEGLRVPGSDLRIYPGLRHEIFNEPERERVFEDVLGWMRKQRSEASS